MSSPHNGAGPGPFQIQYTDEARIQLERLEAHTCTKVQERMRVITAVDPYAHGRADPLTRHKDRRTVDIEGLVIDFWVSFQVGIVTVVSIREGGSDPKWSAPAPSQPPQYRPGPFQDFTDDEDEDSAPTRGRFVRAGAL